MRKDWDEDEDEERERDFLMVDVWNSDIINPILYCLHMYGKQEARYYIDESELEYRQRRWIFLSDASRPLTRERKGSIINLN